MVTDKKFIEEMQQALKDNLINQIQKMMIIRVNYNDLGCGDDAPLSITIEGRLIN